MDQHLKSGNTADIMKRIEERLEAIDNLVTQAVAR